MNRTSVTVKKTKKIRRKSREEKDIIWSKALTVTGVIFGYIVPLYAALWYSFTKTWQLSHLYRSYQKGAALLAIALGFCLLGIAWAFSKKKRGTRLRVEQDEMWKTIQRQQSILLGLQLFFWIFVFGAALLVIKIIQPLF